MATVMIIGAGGQIANDLVPTLYQRGDQMTWVDRVPAAETVNGRAFGALFRGEPDWQERWHVLDATDEAAVRRLVHEARPEVVYHLAAMLSARGEADPDAAWRVNVGSFRIVLEALREAAGDGARPQLIWPSSIAAFGPPFEAREPFQASDEHPLLPRTMYGVTKVACELLGAYYAEHRGVDFRAVRFPGLLNTAPPGGGSSDYANAMYFAAARGEAATSFVRPETRMPFMYMADAVRALTHLAAADEARLTRRTYNVSAFAAPSAEEIAASIARRVPGFQVRYEPDGRQAIVDSWPEDFDDSAARRDWGWEAQVASLDELTRRLLADLRAAP